MFLAITAAIPSSSTSVSHTVTEIDDITPDEKLIDLETHNVAEIPPLTWNADTFDLADIQKGKLEDNMKLNIMQSVLLPKQPYVFPFSQGKLKKESFKRNGFQTQKQDFLF